MDYSVRPTRNEVEKVTSIIDNAVNSYSYGLDVENVEFFLGWQRIEEDFSVLEVEDHEINAAVNPDAKDFENIEEKVVEALLEVEFMEKSDFNSIEFKWQEVLKFAYVALRMKELTGSELEVDEHLEERWPHIRDQLGEKTSNYDQFFYMNTLRIGEAIAEKLGKTSEELSGLKKSDIEEAGAKL